jgi:hypothetical protein
MIRLADTLLKKKTLPYFARAAGCDRRFANSSKKGSTQARLAHKTIVESIKSLKTEVLLCPGQCAKDINTRLLNQIRRLVVIQYDLAAQSQRAGRRSCKNTDAGVALTKPIKIELEKEVNSCPNQVCK